LLYLGLKRGFLKKKRVKLQWVIFYFSNYVVTVIITTVVAGDRATQEYDTSTATNLYGIEAV